MSIVYLLVGRTKDTTSSQKMKTVKIRYKKTQTVSNTTKRNVQPHLCSYTYPNPIIPTRWMDIKHIYIHILHYRKIRHWSGTSVISSFARGFVKPKTRWPLWADYWAKSESGTRTIVPKIFTNWNVSFGQRSKRYTNTQCEQILWGKQGHDTCHAEIPHKCTTIYVISTSCHTLLLMAKCVT